MTRFKTTIKFLLPRLLLSILCLYVFIDSSSVLINYYRNNSTDSIYDGWGDAIYSLVYAVIVATCILFIEKSKHRIDFITTAILLVGFILSIVIVGVGKFWLDLTITAIFIANNTRLLIRYFKKQMSYK